MCMVEFFPRENAPVAILAVGSKKVCLSDMDRDEQFPISVRLAMCPSERERDPASCQASGMPIGPNSSELPVHVVLILPLLVPPLHAPSSGTGTGRATSTASPLLFLGLASEVSSSPAVVVTKMSWLLLVPATALSSRRFFPRVFVCVYNKQYSREYTTLRCTCRAYWLIML